MDDDPTLDQPPPTGGTEPRTPSGGWPSRLRARLARATRATADFEGRNHERIVVYILVFSAVMGATAIWQAAEHGDRADNLFQQARSSQLLREQQRTSLHARIEHDLALASRYAATLVARDGFLRGTVLADDDLAESLVAQAAAEEIARRSLEPFFLLGRVPTADALARWRKGEDPVYDARYVRQEEELADLGLTQLDVEPLYVQAAMEHEVERGLLFAAIVLAVAILLATAADATEDRMRLRRLWEGLAVGCAAGGVLVLSGLVSFMVLAGALGLATVFIWLMALNFRAPSLPAPATPWARRLVALVPRRETHWYAELMGAATLVALTASALGLATATGAEARAAAEADRLTARAVSAFQRGESEAIHDLDVLAEMSLTDALSATQQAGADVWLDAHRQLTELLAGGLVREQVEADRTALAPLLNELREDPAALWKHMAQTAESGFDQSVRGWFEGESANAEGRRATAYTTAVVVLGLAGFLFAVAADRGRTAATAKRLLAAGLVSALAGAVIGLAASNAASSALNEDDREEFSADYAAGRVAVLAGESSDATARFDAAIERYGGFAPAFADRAAARMQQAGPEISGLLVNVIDPDALANIEADLRDAARASEAQSQQLADLGWVRFLQGLGGDRAAITESISLLREALAAKSDFQAHPVPRLNLAAAYVASGDAGSAEIAYEAALSCMLHDGWNERAGECDGESRESAWLPEWVLGGLTDLYLIRDRMDVDIDEFRDRLIRAALEDTDAQGDLPEARIELAIYPQEFELSIIDEGSETDLTRQAVLGLYYREPDGEDWQGFWLQVGSLQDFIDPVAAGRALPPGDYRAELYFGANSPPLLSETFEHDIDEARVITWHELGMAAAVPSAWQSGAPAEGAYGRVARYESEDRSQRLVVMRLENTNASDLEETLERETVGLFGTLGAHDAVEEPYFLLSEIAAVDIAAHWYPEDWLWAEAGFVSYGDASACPGTTYLAWVYGFDAHDAGGGRQLINSLVAEPPLKVALSGSQQAARDSGGLSFDVEGEDFTVSLPTAWLTATELPGENGQAMAAIDCNSGIASVDVWVETVDRGTDLGTLVEEEEALLAEDLTGFAVELREDVVLEDETPAIRLDFSSGEADDRTYQATLFALRDDETLFELIVTVPADSLTDYTEDLERAMDSFSFGVAEASVTGLEFTGDDGRRATALPGGAEVLCAEWDYEKMQDGTPWSADWFINGEPSPLHSLPTVDWPGPTAGNHEICIRDASGLPDGLFELVIRASGEVAETDSVFVGGDHPEVALDLLNATGQLICYAYISPSDAQFWGSDDLGEAVIPAESTHTLPVAAGTYDIRVEGSADPSVTDQPCRAEQTVLVEEYDVELASDTVYTVGDASASGPLPSAGGVGTTDRLEQAFASFEPIHGLLAGEPCAFGELGENWCDIVADPAFQDVEDGDHVAGMQWLSSDGIVTEFSLWVPERHPSRMDVLLAAASLTDSAAPEVEQWIVDNWSLPPLNAGPLTQTLGTLTVELRRVEATGDPAGPYIFLDIASG